MPENPPAASHAWRSSALLLAVLLVAAGLVTVDLRSADATPVVVSRAGDKAHRWAGYRIPRNGHADGGWMGGYMIGDTPVFVVTPTRRPNRRGYEAAYVVEDLGESRGASRRSTARAAWVLSKYGAYGTLGRLPPSTPPCTTCWSAAGGGSTTNAERPGSGTAATRPRCAGSPGSCWDRAASSRASTR